MNQYSYHCCRPKKKKKKKRDCRKLGIIMLLMGIVTVLAIFLPIKYWVLLLATALVIFGVLLLK